MKDIKGFEGLYAVTEDGKVWSYPKRAWAGGWMKGQVNRYGYLSVKFNRKHHGVIHRLVAEAFILNDENKPQVNHKDGNKLNNNVDNLEWVTNKENSDHAFSTGIKKKPLTTTQVIKIRELCKTKNYKKVAVQFCLSPANIWDIKAKRTYAEV